MALYDFECPECGEVLTLSFSMNDDKGRKNAECPDCKVKLKRIYNVPGAIVKQGLGDMKLGPSQKFVDVDGRPVVMNFIDHGKRSGLADDSIAKQIPGARIDEKTGQAVVDVVSNTPDPLGKIDAVRQKSMREGRSKIEKKKINTPVKTRKK